MVADGLFFLCPITKPLRCSSVGMQRWNRELAAVYEGRAV